MNQFLRFFLIFTVFWLLLSFLLPSPKQETITNDLTLIAKDDEVTQGQLVEIRMRNNLKNSVIIGEGCPEESDVMISRFANGVWKQQSLQSAPVCKQQLLPYNEWVVISYPEQNHDLFWETGPYRISVPVNIEGKKKEFFTEIVVEKPGIFKTIWNVFFYKPIYNALIYLSSIGGMNLGIGVVLLTLVIRIILLGPTHKAMRSQRMFQKIQPEIARIRKKYEGDQQKIATETMAIWKKHKVNPMSSLGPIFMQFPVLIALFFVVQEGLSVNNVYLLYEPIKSIDISSIHTMFFGLDMAQIDMFLLPLIVGGLQFLQMKLVYLKQPKQQKGEGMMAEQMAMAGKMMMYFLPIMIAIFTATLPAAVGVYWGVSAIFSSIQQLFINRL